MTTHHVQRLIRACAMSYLAMVPAMGEESKLPADLACSTIIKSSADAAEKADWIVEGTLDDGMMPNGDQARLNLIFSNLEGLNGGWPYRQGATGTIAVGPCLPGGRKLFEGAAGKRLFGQRLRMYGSKHLDDPYRRVFFIEHVTQKLPVIRLAPAVPTKTKVHRQGATNPLVGGWNRAHSTEGAFTVDVPAPFQDVTAISSGKAGLMAGYMIRATDSKGSTFVAVREPNSPDSSMAGSFDTEIKKAGAHIIQFKGVQAVATTAPRGPEIMHSLLFRVPGGTYMLGVSVPKELEQESAAMRERFYQSLAFD